VLNIAMPAVPGLKTDIGIDPEGTWKTAKKRFAAFPDGAAFRRQLRELAAQHRITLTGLATLMDDPDNPDASLQRAKARLRGDGRRGISTYAVSPVLLENPKALRKLDAFVATNKLEGKVFAHIARDPRQGAWETSVTRIQAWNKAAPHIPALVTTQGQHPFLAADAGIWALHTPVFDTGNRAAIQEAAQAGKEIWVYVNHGPGRPYANLFTDMDMVDHRMLFWQAWALGATGFYYGNAADWSRESHADVTPANGYGLLVYPSEKGPVPSLRLEAMRDGIEDYDYLTMLVARLAKAGERPELAGVVADIRARTELSGLMQGMTEYTRDPAALAAKREIIGDAIVALDMALAK
jgi:Glycoside hydrolase 123, catalytic domain